VIFLNTAVLNGLSYQHETVDNDLEIT